MKGDYEDFYALKAAKNKAKQSQYAGLWPEIRNTKLEIRNYEERELKDGSEGNFICNDPLHKQCDLLHLKGRFVMGHLSRYLQTKQIMSDELLRKVVKLCSG